MHVTWTVRDIVPGVKFGSTPTYLQMIGELVNTSWSEDFRRFTQVNLQDGRVFGPFTAAELAEQLTKMGVLPEAVWRDGLLSKAQHSASSKDS